MATHTTGAGLELEFGDTYTRSQTPEAARLVIGELVALRGVNISSSTKALGTPDER